jgi:hypothetical protein
MGKLYSTRGEIKHIQYTLDWKPEESSYEGELTINMDMKSDSTSERKTLKMGTDLSRLRTGSTGGLL